MANTTGREAFFEVARSEGARYLFANPGTTELPIFDELADDAGIELILALQEATAVAAADGYAQATRRPALVNLHIAPGLANGIGNIFNASWSGSPLVITAGQQNTTQLIQEPMLAADLVSMVAQFCKWSVEVVRPEDIGIAMRRAFKVAASPPTGPVFVSIPWDYLDAPADVTVPARSRIEHGSPADPAAVADAADLLLAASDPVIIAGDEVARAGAVPDLVVLAETLGARVIAEPLNGRLNFPMDHPLWNGMLLPANMMIRAGLERGDVILALGALMFAPFFPSPDPPIPEGKTVIQVDPDPWQIAKTYPVALGMRADVGATIRALTASITARATDAQRAAMATRRTANTDERTAAVQMLDAAVAMQREQDPLPSLAACAAVAEAFGDDPVTIVDESVTASVGLRQVLRLRDPDSYFFFRGGGLGWAIPAAAGVQLAQPHRRVVAVVGDGAALYVPQALWTLAHHDIAATIVVVNNGGYQILKNQMLGMAGKAAKAETYPGMDITGPAVDFMALAASFGVSAVRAERPDQITAAVRKGMDADGPSLVEVPVDRTVVPLGG
jgi:benzoylformate decarboxylase